MKRRWSRRQRRVWRTVAIGGLLLVAAVVAVVLRPRAKPYVPGEEMQGLTRDLARSVPPDHPQVTFVDVSREVGIDFSHFHGARSRQLPEDMGSGAAWGDYDNDGRVDLYLVNEAGPLTLSERQLQASPASNALYHNEGDGTFREVGQAAGVDYRGCGQAAAWGDYDSDGRLDLCTTNYGVNLLYHNKSDGTFDEVAQTSGLGSDKGFWTGVSWADYDRDGDLDLYICGYVQYRYTAAHTQTHTLQYNRAIPASLNPSTYKPERNLLYRNEGDGTFVEVAVAAAVANESGRSLSASWADFDDDGWPDLYVANDLSDNVLFHNQGDGTFADISHAAWVADYRGAMGLATGDWDGDADLDLFVTHWIAQENALYNNLKNDYAATGVQQSGAPMGFFDIAEQQGLGQIALEYVGWGTVFFDLDNDGRLDLFVVNGSTFQREDDPLLLVPMADQLFWNAGERRGFFEIGAVAGAAFASRQVGRGLAAGDYDNDGDVDLLATVNGGSARLLRNDGGNAQHWLKVRLRSRLGNRFGVGARLRLVAGGRSILHQVGSSSSYYSQHAVGEALFGLGAAAQVDTLEIRWPDGAYQVLTALATNQTLVIEAEAVGEGERGVR